ncbi:MAG TPA: sucrase ferredoxin [Aggregatilineaceae bacterium]|nr:sucrase ferredoxin [Aggregatilineaceae bacterium]
MEGLYCSEYSQRVNEPIYATASRAELWLLLEYNGRWEPKAFENSELPAPVKMVLATAVDQLPHARIQLIRQPLHQNGLAFYVALARASNPVLYEFRLDSYTDLLAFDLAGLYAENPIYAANLRADPLFLVCTHGRRDKCCARYGMPVYEALAAQFGSSVWQTTHVGGHRFAANLLCFPHGLYFGRTDPRRAEMLVQHYRRGQILLDHFRGRACYPEPVQAAEYFLRREMGLTEVDALHLEQMESIEEQVWNITFSTAIQAHYCIGIKAESDFETWTSCQDTAPSLTTLYRLTDCEQL